MKHTSSSWPRHFICKYLLPPAQNKNPFPNKNSHTNVYSSFLHDRPEAVQMSIHRWMHKQTAAYPNHGMPSKQKKQTTSKCQMDECQQQVAGVSEPASHRLERSISSLPKTLSHDVTLKTWNQWWQKYLHIRKNQQKLQISASLSLKSHLFGIYQHATSCTRLSASIQFYTEVAAFGGHVNHISMTVIPKVINSPVLIAGALPAVGCLGHRETQEPRYLGLEAILQFPSLHTLPGEGRTKSPGPPRRFWLTNLFPTSKLTSSKLLPVKFI